MIDQGTEHGTRAARRLRDEIVVWMTTVAGSGAPLPMPVWFLWDGDEEILMYSRETARVRNVEANPLVSLNFDGDGSGGDIVVLSGEATVDRDAPPADQNDAYVAKYAEHITRLGMTPDTFARRYSVPIRVRLRKLRGH